MWCLLTALPKYKFVWIGKNFLWDAADAFQVGEAYIRHKLMSQPKPLAFSVSEIIISKIIVQKLVCNNGEISYDKNVIVHGKQPAHLDLRIFVFYSLFKLFQVQRTTPHLFINVLLTDHMTIVIKFQLIVPDTTPQLLTDGLRQTATQAVKQRHKQQGILVLGLF